MKPSTGQTYLATCGDNGAACSEDGDCCSGNCYVDADGDCYATTTGTSTCQANSKLGDNDCYDRNANAYSGQASYFTTHRGDGSFDYDCDGGESKSDCTGYTDFTLGTSEDCFEYDDCTGEIILYTSCSETGETEHDCGVEWDLATCTQMAC